MRKSCQCWVCWRSRYFEIFFANIYPYFYLVLGGLWVSTNPGITSHTLIQAKPYIYITNWDPFGPNVVLPFWISYSQKEAVTQFCNNSQWQIQDFLLGGCWAIGGGTDLRCGCFLAKMYVKTKELDPVGGGMCQWCPPWIRQWFSPVCLEHSGICKFLFSD